jgi:8-oxo-dGTP diphosphatase
VAKVPGPAPHVVVGAAVLAGNRLLAARRRDAGPTQGGWELPGGKVEAGESDLAALVREVREELGVTVVPGRPVLPRDGRPDWPLPGVGVLRVWTAAVSDGNPPVAAADHDALRWLAHDEAFDVEWLPADVAVVAELRHLGRTSGLWTPDRPGSPP